MDFRQNSSAPTARPEQVSVSTGNSDLGKKPGRNFTKPSWMTLLSGLALFGVVVLLLTAAFALANGKTGGSDESEKVNTSKYQAVFLNNGQVYFGKVADLNSNFLDLRNVYYLTQSSSATNGTQAATGDYTLVKLGCQQIHNPEDQMVISRDQITFWENLSNDGKVVKSIEEFKKQNPKGPNCTETTSQTPATNTPSQAGTQSTQQTSTPPKQ